MGSVLIVGGATGIGRATALAMSAEGHVVTLADIDLSGAQRVAAEAPGQIVAVACDVGTTDGPAAAVAAAVAAGGGLDTLIANAGVLIAHPLAEWTVEDWDRTMAVNVRGPFLLAQAAAPHMSVSPNASIVFTASTGSFRGHAGMPAYAASKAALVNLVRALADELSPAGIRVNAVCPGWIDTPFNDPHWEHQPNPAEALELLEAAIPMRRQGDPGDVVGTMRFLASPASAYVSGTAIVVDGGYLAV